MSSIMEKICLLDLSPAVEQVDFPSLQPFTFTLPGRSVRPDPVIRLGSPIDLEAELKIELEAEAEAEAKKKREVVPAAVKAVPFQLPSFKAVPARALPLPGKTAAPQTPVKGRSSPPQANKVAAPKTPVKGRYSPPQPNKAVVAVKGKPDTSKKPPQGKAHEYLMRSGLSQLQPKRTINRYSGPAQPPTGPTSTQTARPRWTLTSASVFSCREEERAAAARSLKESFGPNSIRDSTFFEWGLRYMPLPTDATANTYRTVIIEQLPLQVTLDQVLGRIRGGQIYSATLIEPKLVPRMKSPTAIIVFVRESGAMAFLRRVAQEGFYIGFREVKVRQVSTPTYALSHDMERHISRLGRTRCVVVSSFKPRLRRLIHNMLLKSPCSRYVECFGQRDPPGKVTVQFFSIRSARLAFDRMTEHVNFVDCTLSFGPDPCDFA